MPNKIIFNEEQKQKIIKFYCEEKLSQLQIAKEMNVSKPVISKFLIENNRKFLLKKFIKIKQYI